MPSALQAGIYKQAALPLINNLGDFCSYCETRIPGHLDVEHTLAKSEFPTFATEWANFLLACGPCNTKKLNKPGRSEVRIWLSPPGGRDVSNEAECETEVRSNHYVWPDLDSGSYQVLPIKMFWDNNGAWTEVPAQHAFDPSRTCTVDLLNEKVEADFPSWSRTKVSVQAQVVAAGLVNRPEEMIKLCKLNHTGSAPYDRRVVNRTRAWFEALAALQVLQASPKSQFSLVWNLVGATARNLGFFSVWLRVLDHNSPKDPKGVKLSDRFLNDFSRDFPNTNTAQVP